MTQPDEFLQTPTAIALHDLHGKGWLFIALGVVLVVLGFVAGANLLFATVVTIYFIGAMMLVAGIAQLVHAFHVRGWQAVTFWILSAFLYAAAGIFTYFDPVLAAVTLTLLLAVMLMAAGIVRVWLAVASRDRRGWAWIALSGIITFLAGLVIELGWPTSSLFILGLLLALDLIAQGFMAMAFGITLRRWDARGGPLGPMVTPFAPHP